MSNVSFTEFAVAVKEAISSNRELKDDKEYRVKVGDVIRKFKVETWGESAKHIDEKLGQWISPIENDVGELWSTVRNLSFQRIKDLENGKAKLAHALAVHFRLHAELDRLHFAEEIDYFIFGGETFKQVNRKCVFERREDGQQRLRPTHAQALKHSDAYQKQRAEFQAAKAALLAPTEWPGASSTAVYGAGGYGKSLIAQELSDDQEIQARFSGGIYWLQFGLIDSRDENTGIVRLSEAIDRMLGAQYLSAERPSLTWENRDSDILTLLRVLPEGPLLLVADDVWTEGQLSWLDELPDHVSVLITTRRQSVVRRAANEVSIKRLTDELSYKLLSHGMGEIPPDRQQKIQNIAKGFKGWPLLLALANGVFKQMGGNSHVRIDKALAEYQQFLADDQIDGWDIEEVGEEELIKRQKLVGFCIEAGLRAVHSSNKPELLRVLAVFPDDTEIPFCVAIDLWSRISGQRISETKGLTALRHFSDFSFFSSFDSEARLLRLHDEVLAYFRTSAGDQQLRALHREVVASIRAHTDENWDKLRQDHTYGWTRILYHLEKAGLADEADDLRTDFRWLKAKLAAVGVSELQRSFVPLPKRKDARAVARAVNLSMSTLSSRPEALAHQLFGRLGRGSEARLQQIAQTAQSDPNCWPIPVKPHLSRFGPELLRLVGHSGSVNSAVFDQSGRKVVTSSDDQTARIWDAETGVPIGKPLAGHSGIVRSAAFNPSGDIVVTSSDDATARLWHAETGASIGEPLKGDDLIVTGAIFDASGTKILTASVLGDIYLWDATTGDPIGAPLKMYDYIFVREAFQSLGGRIVVASDFGKPHLLDVRTGESIENPMIASEIRKDVFAFDAIFRRALIRGTGSSALLYDTATGVPIGQPIEGHSGAVLRAAFDIAGCRMVTVSNDCTARLWDANTGVPIGKPFEGHDHVVLNATFDDTGRRIVTASRDHTARIWDADINTPTGKFERRTSWVTSAASDLIRRRVVIRSPNGSVQLCNSESLDPIYYFEDHSQSVILTVAFDPNDRRIVTVTAIGSPQLWDAKTGALIGRLEGHESAVRFVAFDLDGRRVATASYDKTARLWDAETGLPVAKLEGHSSYVVSVAFDPSGRKVITASEDYTARLWNAETGASMGRPLERHDRTINSAVFDPSGRKVVTASDDRTAQLWDAETGAPIAKPLVGHYREVDKASFDPSGRRVVTISYDNTVRLWDSETGLPIGKPLTGHFGGISTATFDPSGRKMVTASYDRTIRLWDVETGACLSVVDFDAACVGAIWHHTHLSVGLRTGQSFNFKLNLHQ